MILRVLHRINWIEATLRQVNNQKKGRPKVVRDRSLDIILMVFFGIGGTIILVLTWAQPMLLPERILSTSIGLTGLFWTIARAMLLRSRPAEIAVKRTGGQDITGGNILVKDIK